MDLRFLLLQSCFFISGFAALLYETAWTREFAFVFGTSELAVTAVLAAYMAGLALGAALASRLAHRIQRPVLAYGIIELGIGLGGLAVPFAIRGLMGLYVNWLGGLEAPPDTVGLTSALFHLAGAFIVLVPCTALMGATLPLLARHAVQTEDQVGPRIGYLYAVNTAGAISGTLVAAFFLLPELGLRRTIYAGALANALVFVVAAILSRYAPIRDASAARRSAKFALILPLIAISGAVSFVYEVLWVRLFGFVLGGSTAAFATMLASFLLGISLGSALASRFARNASRAGPGFAWAQLAIALMAWLSFSWTDRIPSLVSEFNGLAVSFAGFSSPLLSGAAVAIMALLPVTLCIGASFPFAVRLLAVDVDDAASASARVYAWNTLGSIVGSVAAGFWLLPIFGFEGTLAVGVMVNIALAITASLWFMSGFWVKVLVPVGVAAGVALMVGRPGPPLSLLQSTALGGQGVTSQLEFLGVGRSATVTIARLPHALQIAANGLPESMIEAPASPPDLYQEGAWLSLLPLLSRPDTESVLIIGLGGGRTLSAVPPSVREVDLIELEPEIVEANRRAVAHYGLPDPLDDPRLNLRIGDARGALMLTGRNYDAIISQPSHPWTSGASHLYTREFFSLVKNRLVPGGVFVQWMGLRFIDDPLLRGLVGTLSTVFEHVSVLRPVGGAVLFMASDQKLDLVETAERAIAKAPAEFSEIGVHDVTDVVSSLRLEGEESRKFATGHPLITDDHNHLAWAGRGRSKMENGRGVQGLELHDALPRMPLRGDIGGLMRRLAASGSDDRAQAVITSLQGVTKRVASGWYSLSTGRLAQAVENFQKALEDDPLEESAWIGLALAGGESIEPGRLPSSAEAVVRAVRFGQGNDWQGVRKLDVQLAESIPGSLLYPEATRLRVSWRLASNSSERAREALELIDVLIARDRNAADLLLRARAAVLAGRVDVAWASLWRLSGSLAGIQQPRPLARGGLRLAEQLEPDANSARTIARLRSVFR